MAVHAAVAASLEEHPPLDADGLFTELRRSGFDLRRAVFVAYLVEMGPDRDAAYALHRAAAQQWDATLYGDASGWVVRLARTERLRPRSLAAHRVELRRLTRIHGGWVRGLTVEDLRIDDGWEALADRQQQAVAAHRARRPDELTLRPATRNA